jgi:hypothetical protein
VREAESAIRGIVREIIVALRVIEQISGSPWHAQPNDAVPRLRFSDCD